MVAALAVDARRIGGFTPEADVLPCGLQGKNNLRLLTEEIRSANTKFSLKEASALARLAAPVTPGDPNSENAVTAMLAMVPRSPGKPEASNVVALPTQNRTQVMNYRELVEDDAKKFEANELNQPQQSKRKSRKARKQDRRTVQKAKKAEAKRISELAREGAAKPKPEPVVKKVAKRNAEPTSYNSKVYTPDVAQCYVNKVVEGKVAEARKFLHDAFGIEKYQSISDHDRRVTEMNAFIADNIGAIKEAVLAYEPEYTGESESAEWSAEGNPITLTRSHRVKRWVNKGGELRRKGWEVKQCKQTIPSGLYNWLEKNWEMTKSNQRPLAVMLGLNGTVPVTLRYREAVLIGGVRVGTRYVVENTHVPASSNIPGQSAYADDKMAYEVRAWHGKRSANSPVVDLPTPPAVVSAITTNATVRVEDAANDTPPWVEEEVDSFLHPSQYNSLRNAHVKKCVEEAEMYSDLEKVRSHLRHKEFEQNYLDRVIPRFVLAGTPQPEAVIQDETEQQAAALESFADAYHHQVDWKDNTAELISTGPAKRKSIVDKIMDEVLTDDEKNLDPEKEAWLFHRSTKPGSRGYLYTTNPHLLAEAARWNKARRTEQRAIEKSRRYPAMSDAKRYERHWQRLLSETPAQTVEESLLRLDMTQPTAVNWWGDIVTKTVPVRRVVHKQLAKIGRKRIKKMQRLAKVDSALERLQARTAEKDVEFVGPKKRQHNPYKLCKPTASSPAEGKGKGMVMTMTGKADVKPTSSTVPDKSEEERKIIAEICAKVNSVEGWITEANTILKSKVVDINKARQLMDHFSKGPEGILVPI